MNLFKANDFNQLFEGIAINRETSQEIAQELMSKIQEFTKRVKSGM